MRRMGLSNFLGSNQDKIAKLRGELEQKRAEVKQIEDGVSRLAQLHTEIAMLEDRIAAGIRFVQPDYPDWKPDKIKPVKRGVWKNPFKSGDMGRTALSVLREHGGWLRPSEVAKIMLDQIGFDADDREGREKVTNAVGNYFRKHEGDLVESRGDYAKEWRVIRQNGE